MSEQIIISQLKNIRNSNPLINYWASQSNMAGSGHGGFWTCLVLGVDYFCLVLGVDYFC